MSTYRSDTEPAIRIRARELDPLQMPHLFLQRWRKLSEHAIMPNSFMSREFVLQCLKHFPRAAPPILLTGEDMQTGELLGLGIFENRTASKALPLPHLGPFKFKHLYRDGMLVADGREVEFLTALLIYLAEEQEDWFGLEFRNLTVEEHWARQLRILAPEYGCSFRLIPKFHSPAVELDRLSETGLESVWSSSRRKSMRRNRNRLEKLGPVQFRIVRQGQELRKTLDRFLQLEQESWKGELGTSLLCDPRDTAFVREMVKRYASAGNALLSELMVGEEVAATAINLRAGNTCYAFKIGWNEKFADASPGVLHEAELIRTLRQEYPELTFVDSCANGDSYLKTLWPDQLAIGDGLLSITTLARGTGKLIGKLRRLKRWAGQKLREVKTIPAPAVTEPDQRTPGTTCGSGAEVVAEGVVAG